jgi:hypothetical protein
MAGERAIIFDPEDHDSTIRIREAGDLLGDLIAYGSSIARALAARRTFEQ